MADVTGAEKKKKFSEKVVNMKEFDGVSNGGSWKTWGRNYLVSQMREMDFLVKIVETHEDQEAIYTIFFTSILKSHCPCACITLEPDFCGCC